MLTNMSIGERLLGLLFINVGILLLIIFNANILTSTNASKLTHIQSKYLPIHTIHTENVFILKNIMNDFVYVVVSNDKEILLHTEKSRQKLLENFEQLNKYGIQIKESKNILMKYYQSAYSFSMKILDNNGFYTLQEAQEIKNYSNQVLILFEKSKKNSEFNLNNAIDNVLQENNIFFDYLLLISFLGLNIMLFLGLYLYRQVKSRFNKIITSVQMITKKEPDFSQQIENMYNDEVGELIDAFNLLYDKLQKAHNASSILLLEEIEATQKEVVFTMGSIAESRSKETGNHVKRVAEYSKLLALIYGLDKDEAEMLKQASPMHDIGKVAIPDSILNKESSFTLHERKIMDSHVLLGYDMLKYSQRPLLKMASIVALEHHEKWDGSGYPYAKSGENIHIYGRITALADVFDALGSQRVYKAAWSDTEIFHYLREERGKHFDPKLIDIFFENKEKFFEIRETFKDKKLES